MRHMLVHAVARLSLAFIFAYHGLVPKLIANDADELAMLRNAGIPPELTGTAMIVLGLAELLFAAGLLVYWRRKEPVIIALVMMFIATIGVALTSPRCLVAAFNPVSLNLATMCLATIDLLVLDDVPSAGDSGGFRL
jgi:DoxX-like protein